MDIIESVRQSLAQGPRIVEGLIAAAPKEALTWREADGTWNMVEVLCHVADGETTDWMPRVEGILAGGGRFMPFDRDGGFSRYRGWTAEALRGEHPEFGPVTLEQRRPVEEVFQPASRSYCVSETFQEYSARLLSLSNGKDAWSVLAETPGRLGALVAGHAQEDLRWTTSPSRWSIAQIVAHLADAEVVGAYRFRMILGAPGTPIQAFDQDAWAREMDYATRDAAESLALFGALRASLLQLVRGLDDGKLDRFGIHAERGKESVRHLIALYAGHDLNHLAQIERLTVERAVHLGGVPTKRG